MYGIHYALSQWLQEYSLQQTTSVPLFYLHFRFHGTEFALMPCILERRLPDMAMLFRFWMMCTKLVCEYLKGAIHSAVESKLGAIGHKRM